MADLVLGPWTAACSRVERDEEVPWVNMFADIAVAVVVVLDGVVRA